MIKETLDISPERQKEVFSVARNAKEQGFSKRERRDKVITEIGESSLDLEKENVAERALNKYWSLELGSKEVPVLLVAPHSMKPGLGELVSLLREKFPEREHNELYKLSENWTKAKNKDKPHKVLPKDHPNMEVYERIADIRNIGEPGTDTIVELTKESGASAMIAKKSRMIGDANRKSFFQKPRGAGKGKNFIQTKEYPTSIRASWYWGVKRAVEHTIGLKADHKIKNAFLQIVFHGMIDRKYESGEKGYDIVIAGGDPTKEESSAIADEKTKNWFAKNLTEKFNQIIQTSEMENKEIYRVAIEESNREEIRIFDINKDLKTEELSGRKLGGSFAGAQLGLEYFRKGNVFKVQKMDGGEKEMTFPGFGNQFQTIQIEISRRIRKNKELRIYLAKSLKEVIKEFCIKSNRE